LYARKLLKKGRKKDEKSPCKKRRKWLNMVGRIGGNHSSRADFTANTRRGIDIVRVKNIKKIN
jgi:hypothetical protein